VEGFELVRVWAGSITEYSGKRQASREHVCSQTLPLYFFASLLSPDASALEGESGTVPSAAKTVLAAGRWDGLRRLTGIRVLAWPFARRPCSLRLTFGKLRSFARAMATRST